MSDWRARCAEATALAQRADETPTADRLMELLLDPEDSAVSQAAAEGLLQRGDLVGIRLFAQAFDAAEDDTRMKLSDCLYDEQRWEQVQTLLTQLPDNGIALREFMAG